MRNVRTGRSFGAQVARRAYTGAAAVRRLATAAGRIRRRIAAWRYPGAADGRDSRLDFLRGYLIFVMVVDHVAGESWLHTVTGADKFVVSAAEGFVFISGLVMGIVYRRAIARDGLLLAVRRVAQRGLKLYALHALLSLSFAATSRLTGAPWSGSIDDPVGYLVGLLTLQSTNYLTDIILLYAVLVLLAPIPLVLLARGHTPVVVTGSVLLWAIFQLDPWALTTITANYAFPAAGWQVFFVGGLVLGYHRGRVWTWLGMIPRGLAYALLGLAAAGLFAVHHGFGSAITWDSLTRADYDLLFHKWEVRPGRLVASAVFFPLAYMLVTDLWLALRPSLGRLFLPLGRNALLAYSAHMYVVLAAALAIPLLEVSPGEGMLFNSIAQAFGVAAVWALAHERWRDFIVPGLAFAIRGLLAWVFARVASLGWLR